MAEETEAPAIVEVPTEPATNEHDVAIAEAETSARVEIATAEIEAATAIAEAVAEEDTRWQELDTRLSNMEMTLGAMAEKLASCAPSSPIPETSTEEVTGEPIPEVIVPPSEPLPAVSSESVAPTKRKRRWI